MTSKLPPGIHQCQRTATTISLVIILVLLGWGISALVDQSSGDSEPVGIARGDGKEATPLEQPKEPYAPRPGKDSKNGKSGEGVKKDDKEDEDSVKDDIWAALASKKDCSLADLQVTVTSDQPNCGGEQPTLTVAIHNPTGDEYRVGPGEQRLRFGVYDLAIYECARSGVDCNDSEDRGELVSASGEEIDYAATWSRLTSAPNKCFEEDRVLAPSRSYIFYGTIDDNNSDAYAFNVRQRLVPNLSSTALTAVSTSGNRIPTGPFAPLSTIAVSKPVR